MTINTSLLNILYFYRTLILCHKHGLLEKLSNCTDSALVLHLTVLVIFTISSQNILHASGKHVSGILSFLQPVLNNDQSTLLKQFHGWFHFCCFLYTEFKH